MSDTPGKSPAGMALEHARAISRLRNEFPDLFRSEAEIAAMQAEARKIKRRDETVRRIMREALK